MRCGGLSRHASYAFQSLSLSGRVFSSGFGARSYWAPIGPRWSIYNIKCSNFTKVNLNAYWAKLYIFIRNGIALVVWSSRSTYKRLCWGEQLQSIIMLHLFEYMPIQVLSIYCGMLLPGNSCTIYCIIVMHMLLLHNRYSIGISPCLQNCHCAYKCAGHMDSLMYWPGPTSAVDWVELQNSTRFYAQILLAYHARTMDSGSQYAFKALPWRVP